MESARAAVLVVDDEPGTLELLDLELSHQGFEVAKAQTGEAAVQALRQRKFDVAITDLKMPGMDGTATVMALKEIDPDLEIIVATGYATVETAVECMKRGAFDYVSKPFHLAQMRVLLERALEHRRLQGAVALYEAGRALLGTLRQDELTQLVSGLAERALGAERVALLLSADDRTGRQVRWGGNDSQPPIELVERLAARADRESRPLQWPSPDVSDELFGHRDLRWGSALVFPLSVSACSLGSLVLLRASSRAPFSRSELARGALFANLLAVALQNARLYGDLEKRVRELMATRDELVQAERLAMAGRMAGYVAHEISSPLAAIELNLSTLKGYSRPVERLWVASGELAQHLLERRGPASRSLALNMLHAGGSRERTEKLIRGFTPLLDTMLEGTRRIASLVTSFRGLGGLAEKGVVERFEIDDLLDEVVTLASQSAGSKNLRIVREASPALHGFGVRADLRHALMNLLIFLSQEPPSDRERPRAATVGASMIGDRPSLWVHGRNLELTGAQRAHLFDFVEHKDEVKGDLRTQIGLSLAFELVQRSGGTLSAEPSARGGTLFRVVLAGEEPRT